MMSAGTVVWTSSKQGKARKCFISTRISHRAESWNRFARSQALDPVLEYRS